MTVASKNTETPPFLIGLLLGVLVGVPVSLATLYWLQDHATGAMFVLLGILITSAMLFALLIVFRNKILNRLFGPVTGSLQEVTGAVASMATFIARGDAEQAEKQALLAARESAALYSWIQIRRSLIGWMIAVAATTALFMEVMQLVRQNELSTVQNEISEKQTKIVEGQLAVAKVQYKLVSDQHATMEMERLANLRGQLMPILSELARIPLENIDVNGEARFTRKPAQNLVEQIVLLTILSPPLMKERETATLLETPHESEFESKERGIILQSLFQLKVDTKLLALSDAVFSHSNLNRSFIKNSQVSNLDLSSTGFRDAVLEASFFDGVDLRNSTFDGADLRDANFNHCDGDSVSFDGADLRGVSFDENSTFDGSTMKGALLSLSSEFHNGGYPNPDGARISAKNVSQKMVDNWINEMDFDISGWDVKAILNGDEWILNVRSSR